MDHSVAYAASLFTLQRFIPELVLTIVVFDVAMVFIRLLLFSDHVDGKCMIVITSIGFLLLFSDHVERKDYSSLLSFTVTDISSTVTKLMTLGAELDGPIKYEIHGKVISPN